MPLRLFRRSFRPGSSEHFNAIRGPLQQAEAVTLRRLGVMKNGVNIVCAAANVLGSPINATHHHVDVTAGKMFAIVEIWMH